MLIWPPMLQYAAVTGSYAHPRLVTDGEWCVANSDTQEEVVGWPADALSADGRHVTKGAQSEG